MITPLHRLSPYGRQGELRVVVETPRGANTKLKYEPDLGTFVVSRALTLGLTYPYDWGFIPGTRAEDGDPLDALVLHDSSTYPGVVLACRVLGMIKIEQRENRKRETNNRVIAIAMWHERLGKLQNIDRLPLRIREEIEQFFLSTSYFTAKRLKLKGWADRKKTQQFINMHLLRTEHETAKAARKMKPIL